MNHQNLMQIITQAKHYQAHQRKLQQIRKSTPRRKSVGSFDNKRLRTNSQFYRNWDRAVQYDLKSRQQEVDRQNGKILKKIIEVNNRKEANLSKSRSLSHLNMSNIRRSMPNLEVENHKIANKLISAQSLLKQSGQYESYKKHLQRKQRITKFTQNRQYGQVISKKLKFIQKVQQNAQFYKKICKSNRTNFNNQQVGHV